jgi:hypothetical protein
MALTKAPLFGLDASGQVGGSIVFSKWKGRTYVRRLAIPHNPKSGLQVGVRAVFKFVTQAYVALGATPKANWKVIGNKTNVTPLNAQVQYSQRNGRVNLGPIQDPTVGAGTAPSAPASNTATPVPKGNNLAWTAGANAPQYCWLIYRAAGGAPTQDISNLITVLPAATLAYSDRKLVTGTVYHYKIVGGNNNGAVGTLGGDFTGTPT